MSRFRPTYKQYIKNIKQPIQKTITSMFIKQIARGVIDEITCSYEQDARSSRTEEVPNAQNVVEDN